MRVLNAWNKTYVENTYINYEWEVKQHNSAKYNC